jgi:hypothetical protein
MHQIGDLIEVYVITSDYFKICYAKSDISLDDEDRATLTIGFLAKNKMVLIGSEFYYMETC